MKFKTSRDAVLLTSMLLLAACDGRVAGSGEGASRAVPESKTDAANMLTIRPGAIDRCKAKDGVIAVDVEWNATAAHTEGVKVYLQNVGEEEKLWTASGAVGKETTGKWMRNGATIRLVNADGGKELAKLDLGDVPCY